LPRPSRARSLHASVSSNAGRGRAHLLTMSRRSPARGEGRT
jgi:hypothetical protein